MALYVGTSGWSYPEWRPGFYPEGLPRSKWLEHYATVLTACEINATFYRLQSPDTFTKWSIGTPESFRFSTKAHRGLTHSKGIAPDSERRGLLDTFLGSVSTLGPRLGAVLFQFPPYRRRDDGGLKLLLESLPAGNPYAFEFRHRSWDDDGVRETIAGAGGTVCLSETAGEVPQALPPGPIAYVRMRHDRYSRKARAGWLELLASEAKERDVYAFAKHEGIPAGDPFGGVGLARWLAAHA
jgi:uncharacterized protein YecE (DUF72 family)